MLIRIIIIQIATKLFQRFYFIILCPFNQGNSIKFPYAPIVHFIFEIPLHNRLISFVEKLFDFPSNDFATSIPFLKPVLYDLTVIIFWTPTFSINYIFCKNIINT